MKRRSGMSMAEVLVALFILALGTIAILTMFPLGMYHMGQALKDDRTAQCAAQADAIMRTYWRQAVVENGGSTEPFYRALNNPNDSVVAAFQNPAFPVMSNSSPTPSYPVFVDPMGCFMPWGVQNSPSQQYWVGGGNPIPRRNMNWGGSAAQAQRLCSLMDGFGYLETGLPSSSGGMVERELRYNWLWVLQRPDNTALTTATMTVVVFDRRASQYAPANAEQTLPSGAAGSITMQPLFTAVQVPYSSGIPQVQKGGWIMDATYAPPGTPYAPRGMNHAIFYRVVSVTDNPGASTTDLELQTPIVRRDGNTTAFPATLIYLQGVSEVFERPPLTPNDF